MQGKKGISLNEARNAIATVARNSAATQIAGEAATALGEKNVIGGSLASAMMANSVEMGLWGGTQSGTNAHILEKQSMSSETAVALNESNASGLGSVFGTYDKWNEINEQNAKLKNNIKTAEKITQNEISNLKNTAGTVAKKEMKISEEAKTLNKEQNKMLNEGRPDQIKQWQNDWQKLEQEKKDLSIQKQTALKEYTNFMQHRAEYQNEHGEKATLAKQQELLHNMQSGDQRMQEIEAKEAQLQQLHSAEKVVDKAIKQNHEVFDPQAHGSVRLMKYAQNSATGLEHGSHIAKSVVNAMTLGKFAGQTTDAMGNEIRTSNVSSETLARVKAVGNIAPLANQSIAAQNMSPIFRDLYNKSGARTQEILGDMGYGRDALHNMFAFSGMRNTSINTVLNGEDVYATLNAETGGYGSQMYGSRHGVNDTYIHNVDYGGQMVQSVTGDMTINHQQIAATGVSIGKDVAKTVTDVYLGRGLAGGIIKNINNDAGHFSQFRSALNKVLSPKKTGVDTIGGQGNNFDSTLVKYAVQNSRK